MLFMKLRLPVRYARDATAPHASTTLTLDPLTTAFVLVDDDGECGHA